MPSLRIAVAQTNFLVGDLRGNVHLIRDVIHRAKSSLADLLVFPELALCGYPPEDLLLRKDFKQQVSKAIKNIVSQSKGITLLLGHPHYQQGELYNAASLIKNKKIIKTYHKQRLPNYGLFDEKRYFKEGNTDGLFQVNGINIGVLICEDLWHPYPSLALKKKAAQLLICINASPFYLSKAQKRQAIIIQRIKETKLPILYVHGTGGQDDLVFDGGSQAFDATGKLCAHANFFQDSLWEIDINPKGQIVPQKVNLITDPNELSYKALVLAVRDYVNKNHSPGVLIGLSGGIDSALVLAIALDALGKDRVCVASLPSRYTSKLSLEIIDYLVKKTEVPKVSLSIESSVTAFLETLTLDPTHPSTGITIENIQARCRMILLMALSNQTNYLLLNCTNKSELATGFGTLYGDMAGGFAVLKDVYKTRIYQLAAYRNKVAAFFPEILLSRPPTAELSENQKDEDRLPPYAQLDSILELYVEGDRSIDEIVALGFPKKMVHHTVDLVNKSEYKRRQMAPGPRITSRAFGRERRYPITSGF